MAEQTLIDKLRDRLAQDGLSIDALVQDILAHQNSHEDYQNLETLRRDVDTAIFQFFNDTSAVKNPQALLKIATEALNGNSMVAGVLGSLNRDRQEEEKEKSKSRNAIVRAMVISAIQQAQFNLAYTRYNDDMNKLLLGDGRTPGYLQNLAADSEARTLFSLRSEKFRERFGASIIFQDIRPDTTVEEINAGIVAAIADLSEYRGYVLELERHEQESRQFKVEALERIGTTADRLKTIIPSIIDDESRRIVKEIFEALDEKKQLGANQDPQRSAEIDARIDALKNALRARRGQLSPNSPEYKQLESLLNAGIEISDLIGQMRQGLREHDRILAEIAVVKAQIDRLTKDLEQALNTSDRAEKVNQLRTLREQADRLIQSAETLKTSIKTIEAQRQQAVIDVLNSTAETGRGLSFWSRMADRARQSGLGAVIPMDVLYQKQRTIDVDGDGTTEAVTVYKAHHTGFYYIIGANGNRHYLRHDLQEELRRLDLQEAGQQAPGSPRTSFAHTIAPSGPDLSGSFSVVVAPTPRTTPVPTGGPDPNTIGLTSP